MNRTPPDGTQAGEPQAEPQAEQKGHPRIPGDRIPRGRSSTGEDVRAALENAERLVAQTTT